MPVERAAGGSSLIDVLDRILDKGIVIDAWVRVSLVGIDLITVEARVVVASIDTYLRYAEALGITSTVADRKSTRLNSSHSQISYAVFCLKKKKKINEHYSDNALNLGVDLPTAPSSLRIVPCGRPTRVHTINPLRVTTILATLSTPSIQDE